MVVSNHVHVASAARVKANSVVHGHASAVIPARSVPVENVMETDAPLLANTAALSCGAGTGCADEIKALVTVSSDGVR